MTLQALSNDVVLIEKIIDETYVLKKLIVFSKTRVALSVLDTLNTKRVLVYDKKKIQIFVMNMTFISSSEVKKIYISFVASHS